jgi:APA family basic amino acid/polyamine antiporter
MAYLNVLPFQTVQNPPGDRLATAVATSLLGEPGAQLCAAAIMVSTFGCLNGLVLSGARVYFAMARDGLFFHGLCQLNARSVPRNALWAQALWSGTLVLSGTYSELLEYVISVDLVFYTLLVAAVFVLRSKRPTAARPFRVPGYPIVPAAYIAVALALIGVLLVKAPRTTWPGYLLVLTGVPAYGFWRRRSHAL